MHLTAYGKSLPVPIRVTQLQKTLLMIKLTVLLLVVGCLHVSAHSYGQTVTFSKKKASLAEIFEAIHSQTGYFFYYKVEALKQAKPVSLEVNRAPLREVLNLCFASQPLTYEISGDYIIVKEKITETPADTTWLDVRGRVISSRGEAIAGATITVIGLERMITTAENGRFYLPQIPQTAVLEISSIGYKTRRVSVVGGLELLIQMEVIDTKLDEVQVIAYGTQTRRTNTGNVSRVSGSELALQPVSNPLAALHGRVPGLVIQQNTGVPGGGISVQLRGQNSLRANGNDLLYLVDGVPFPSSSIASPFTSVVVLGGNPLNAINPADIESIEVLKDADATSIYGSRGANGVVLITTKKGTTGKTSAQFNINTGWGKIASTMDLLNRREYLDMRLEAFRNDGVEPGPADFDITLWDTSRYTDWQKELVGKTGRYTTAEASFSGGTSRTNWLLSSTYRKETTVFPGDFADQRGSVHINFNHQSEDKRFSSSVSASYLTGNNNLIYTDLLSTALNLPPVAPAIYNANGSLNWERNTWSNPMSIAKKDYIGLTNNLISNLKLGYRLASFLEFRVQGGYTNYSLDEKNLQPSTSYNPAYNPQGRASFSNGKMITWIVEPQLEANVRWKELTIQGLVGATWQQSRRTGQRLEASRYTSDAVLENPAAAGQVAIQDVVNTLYRYQAFFGRLRLSWQDRYILSVTGRRDGSSRFGPGNRYGLFGAVGGAWLLSREAWWKRLENVVSFAKLRASYGSTGNDQIGDYGYLPLWNYTAYRYDDRPALQPMNLFNANYQWEVNRKLEVGTELGFWKDRMFLALSFYRNRSSNQLVGYALPLSTGFSSVQSNLNALVENKGWEIELNGLVIQNTSLTWRLGLNASFPRSRLLRFPGLEGSSYQTQYKIGEPLQIIRAFQWNGVDPATGLHQMEDADKNGQLNYPQDAVKIIPVLVRMSGGFSQTLQWKRLQLDLFFQGQIQEGLGFERYFGMPGIASNQPRYVLDRWQAPGDHARYQRFSQNFSGPEYQLHNYYRNYADATTSDASFLRLKNVSITYSLPEQWIKSMKIKQVQCYVQGQNLWTWTNYRGLDPETQNYRNIPPLRVVVLGARLSF